MRYTYSDNCLGVGSVTNTTTMTEDFVEHVKKALENLYDFPSLQQNPLTIAIQQQNSPQTQLPAHQLRRELMEAIEQLNPQQDNTNSGVTRLYNLVHLHYVGGMTIQEVAHELGISTRQVYRDLRRGQENISAIIWFHHQQRVNTSTKPQAHDLPILTGTISEVKLQDLITHALRATQKLAEKSAVAISQDMPQNPVMRPTNQAAAQQILIHLLSQTIQQLSPQALHITLQQNMHIVFEMHGTTHSTLKIDEVILHLMQQLFWKIQHYQDDKTVRITLRTNTAGTSILIIDDNEGLLDLVKRYLGNADYHTHTANNGADGLDLAERLLPDGIIMDLMMPDMDGWEVLQRLRTLPNTQKIPVVICSVIKDPELAYTLGADKFIAKPIEKDELLLTLQELGL